MENVEIKGKAKKAKNEDEEVVAVRKPKKKDEKTLSAVEADRSEPNPFLKAQIKKMSKEQKETIVEFMKLRNKARIDARMEPAYSEEDMAYYK